ncbi:hypothetical protein CC78DRAFT_612033 [Lojkania enalia]|uniref:Uncharacterized protein n=1 Tax=Lojkania enalia TaxID=147567 RepID=A0A9P4NAL2_9PLEO|nr:hypothetical protein CC78DRAFT_612033 [Didymosphaeria enalia]
MFETTTAGIYVGFWTNWSKGKILGATLTLPSRDGTLLIAFVALFVSWAGNQLWSLLTYLTYQLYASNEPQSTFRRQLRLLLRSHIAVTHFLWRVVKTSWVWRRHTRDSESVLGLPLIVMATLHVAAVTLAGIFSSRIMTTTSEALIRSTCCGFHDLFIFHAQNFTTDELDRASAVHVTGEKLFEYGNKYVRSCYDPSMPPAPNMDCYPYVRRQRIQRNANCTFAKGSCVSPSIRLDSGYLDSHYDLGINQPEENRISVRRVLQCSVIGAEKYSTDWINYTDLPEISPSPMDPLIVPGASYKFFSLGMLKSRRMQRPFTFIVANHSTISTSYYTQAYSASSKGQGFLGFDPIGDLQKDDADVSLRVLQSSASYVGPVHDPWFKATRQYPHGNNTFYLADDVATVLGCIEQYQFCNATKCTSLGPLPPVGQPVSENQSVISVLNYNSIQAATYNLLWKIMAITRTEYFTMNLQDSLLLARDHLLGQSTLSTQLPDNQWETEVQMVYNMSLSLMTMIASFHADMPDVQITRTKTLRQYVTRENTSEALNLCSNQKTTTQAYYSFSVFGLIVSFVGGLFVILLSHLIPSRVSKYRAKYSSQTSALVQARENGWKADDILVLDSIALEAHGVGSWTVKDGVPIPKFCDQNLLVPWISSCAKSSERKSMCSDEAFVYAGPASTLNGTDTEDITMSCVDTKEQKEDIGAEKEVGYGLDCGYIYNFYEEGANFMSDNNSSTYGQGAGGH